MADKSIKITIATALNAAGFTAARRAISNLVSGTKDFAAKVGGNLMNINAGFDMVAGAASKLMQVMSKGMEFERMTVTFKSLTGSMELAKAHMKDLQDLGRNPPFSLEMFSAASKMMMKMTDGMLGYKKSLEMVGDIAAATGNDISQVGRSVGLAYQMIRDGKPFGSAGSQMAQLGILTKAQVEHFDALSKSGKNNMAVWEELTKVLSKYKGAMADTEKTAKGVVEAIQGEATVAITDFSSALSESAKPALESILSKMRELGDDGSIEDWADKTVDSAERVGSAFKTVAEKIGNFFGIGKANTQNTLMAGLGGIGAGFSEGGNYGGGWAGFRKAQLAYVATHASNERVAEGASKALNEKMRASGEWTQDIDIRKEFAKAERENREENRSRAQDRKAKRDAERAKTEAEAEKRIREDMAKTQAEKAAKFEKERQEAINETMAKLRELAGEDIEIPVKVKDPDTVNVNVEEPKPVDVNVNEPKPVKVEVIDPKAINVKVEEPKPVKVEVEEPKPVKVEVEEPKPVKVEVEEPKPVTVKSKVVIDDDAFDALEKKFKTIPEMIKPDMSGVKKALEDIANARTADELKAAKAAVDTAMKRQKAEDDAFRKAQERARESDRNATEFIKAYEKEKEDAAKEAAKAELEANRDAMKKLHDERIKQLDAEHDRVMKIIDAAKTKGYDNLMATAGGGYYDNGTLNQAGEERERRQRVIGAQRAIDAEQKLREKMAKTGATLDDPTKLGRMSNLERAAFERMKLKEAEKNAAKIQKEKDDRQKKMSEDIDAINKKLKEVGL